METLREETLKHAQKLQEAAATMLMETDWDIVKDIDEDNATSLEKKKFQKFNLPHYRLSTMVNLPRENVVEIIWNATETSAKVDDPEIKSYQILHEEDNFRVRRQINRLKWPCWPRETVIAQHRFDTSDSTWLVGFSINCPSVPEKPSKYVRSSLSISCYRYHELGPNQTQVERITNIDPNGDIPGWVITSQTGKMVNAFNRWNALGSN